MPEKGSDRIHNRLLPFGGLFARRAGEEARDAVVERIRAGLSGDMTVLELNCGAGELTYPLCGSVFQWEATDPSPKRLSSAAALPHTDRVRFSVQEAESLPYEHDSFDAVLIFDALRRLRHPERGLREIRRVLRPGGILFAPTRVRSGRLAQAPALFRRSDPDARGLRTAVELEALVRGSGFTVETALLLSVHPGVLCYLEAKHP